MRAHRPSSNRDHQVFWCRRSLLVFQGMSILELMFALMVFVMFAGVMVGVTQQMQAYLGADPALALAEDEEAPSPGLIYWKIADRLRWLSEVLDQPALVDEPLPLGLSNCSSNPLLSPSLSSVVPKSIFSLDENASNTDFLLASRYEICILGPYSKTGPEGQEIYALVAKPIAAYRQSPLLPVVRYVFCRPQPLC